VNALDGNAIAGRLFDIFGVEMMTAKGICARRGAIGVPEPAVELARRYER
jgi:hypothetical protein